MQQQERRSIGPTGFAVENLEAVDLGRTVIDRRSWAAPEVAEWMIVRGPKMALQQTTELSENAFLYFSSCNSMQDRLDALTIFVAVAEQQSFAEAARQLSRSPASVTRAVAALEERLQTRLFNRTTRSVALTDAGARYLEGCRRLLATYDELEAVNFGERVEPRGWINVTAPVMFGRLHVLPSRAKLSRRISAGRCSAAVARPGRLIGGRGARSRRQDRSAARTPRCGRSEWGRYDASFVQLRNTLPATACRRRRAISATTVWWRAQPSHPFPTAGRSTRPSGVTSVAVTPRLVVNTTAAAVDAALDGLGLTCILSYQAEPHAAAGRLQTVLVEYEPPPAPIHIVHPEGRHLPAKVRLFLDHAAEGLRRKFAWST